VYLFVKFHFFVLFLVELLFSNSVSSNVRLCSDPIIRSTLAEQFTLLDDMNYVAKTLPRAQSHYVCQVLWFP